MCKKYKSAARLRYVIHNSRQDWQKNPAPARTHRSQARQGSEAQANSWGASTEPRCRWAALQVGSRARHGAPEEPLLPATAEPRPLSGPAPSRARHRRGAPYNQSGGADGSSRTRPTPAPVGWAGLQRRRWGGERLLCGRRAGPGPAEAALAAVGARSRPAPRPRLPLLPPSPAAEGRGGGAPAASAAASMSSSRAKKVKMATKSCPECDQQVRRGGAWRAAGAVLSCPVLSAVPRLAAGAALPSVPAGTAVLPLGLCLGAGRAAGRARVCGASVPLRCPRPRASGSGASGARPGASRWAPPLFLFSVSSSRLWLSLDVRAVQYAFAAVTAEAASWAAWFSERRKTCAVYSSVCMRHGVAAFAGTGCVCCAPLAAIASLSQRILWRAALLRRWYCLVTTKYIKIQLTL